MNAMQVVPLLKNDKLLELAVTESTLDILEMFEKKGCCPDRFESDEVNVEWCRGAPGLIPLFSLASSILPHYKMRLLKALTACGEITWKQGLLLKGNNLCHGIAGNGYMLHSVYRTYDKLAILMENFKSPEAESLRAQAELWKSRSFMFAYAILD
jgi:hypothetical protein